MNRIPDSTQFAAITQLAEELEEKWPALRGRARRAAAILAEGTATGPAPGSTWLASFESRREPGRVYYVRHTTPDPFLQPRRRILTCTCPDHRHQTAPAVGRRRQAACKHILAVLIARRAGHELPGYDPVGDFIRQRYGEEEVPA